MNEKYPIRVLHVIGRMNVGGAETMVMNIYRKIDRTKVQFDFLVHSKEKGYYEDEIESLGGHIFRIKKFTGFNVLSYYMECNKFFRTHKYPIVHGQIGSCASLYLMAAKRNGAFTIAHSHSALVQKRSLHDYAYSFFSYPTRFIADQLFGCSLQAGICRYGRKAVESGKYKTYYNGIDIKKYSFSQERRSNMRMTLGISDENIVIVSVGRLSPQKNPLKIYDVFSSIVKQCEQAICLWIGTGELYEEYRNKVASAHLEDKIKLLGVRNDVADLLQAADCFLFPSLWEGLPISVVEAQASCLPCIISDAITSEVDITDLVKVLPLDLPSSRWAESCIDAAMAWKDNRYNISNQIKKAGYDIDDTTQWLTNFYLPKAKTIQED